MCFIIAQFSKIRLFYTSYNSNQSPLYRVVFISLLYPSGPNKPCQNANMRVIFSDEGLKKKISLVADMRTHEVNQFRSQSHGKAVVSGASRKMKVISAL